MTLATVYWLALLRLPNSSQSIGTDTGAPGRARDRKTELGVRPEFVRFAATGLPVQVERVSDVGRFRIVDARLGKHALKALIAEGEDVPTGGAHVQFDATRTQLYADGWIVD